MKKGNSIVLIGMMGSGKSSVGRLISEKTGLDFIDTDLLIEKRCKKKISEIYSTSEKLFRSLEREVLIDLLDLKVRSVIASGGGAVTIENGLPILKRLGTLIYLKATPLSLVSRLKNTLRDRPIIYNTNSFEELLNKINNILSDRSRVYESADFTCKTDFLSPAEVFKKIVSNSLIFP